MKHGKDILKELQGISPLLAAMEKQNFYAVPENYFTVFSHQMELATAGEAILKLASVKPVYDVPEGYFSSFSNNLLLEIRKQEVQTESAEFAHLAGLEKKNFYSVPAEYFEAFPEVVLKMALKAEKRKAPSVWRVWNAKLNDAFRNVGDVVFQPKMALAAASLAGVLMIGAIFFGGMENTMQVAELNDLSDQEISQFIAMSSDDFDDRILEKGTNEIDVIHGFENSEDMNARLENYVARESDLDVLQEEVID